MAQGAKKVQEMYQQALKEAKNHVKRGDIEEGLKVMMGFFDQTEILAEYFHHRSIQEVSEEMLDRLEQAQSMLASVFAEYPERAKQFLTGLRDIVDTEFSAFKQMKEQEAGGDQ